MVLDGAICDQNLIRWVNMLYICKMHLYFIIHVTMCHMIFLKGLLHLCFTMQEKAGFCVNYRQGN